MTSKRTADSTTVESSFGYADMIDRASAKYSSFESTITGQSGQDSKQFDYEFDNNGNITEVLQDNLMLLRYSYDEAQQLIREDNRALNKSVTYSYDNHGNILEKKTYPFTTGALRRAYEKKEYAYEDANWPDLLTGWGNAVIVNDEIGNPIQIGDKTLTWTAGRQLASVETAEKTVSYTYDVLGMMASKTVTTIESTETTRYAWTGDLRLAAVLHEDGTVVRVLYDQAKEPFGIAIQDEFGDVQTLLYEKNPQGDIISLIDPLDGSEIACYTYDAYGNAEPPNEIEPGDWGEREQEAELLYAALQALLTGDELEEVETELPEDIEELFDMLLPDVLELELQNLVPLVEMYEFCGYSEPEIDENLQMLVGVFTEYPLMFAANYAFNDLTSSTSQYPKGPTPPTGCLTVDNSYWVAADVFYVGLVEAIRELAEEGLDLDRNDPSDYELANILAALFLFCYFADYVDQINLWREAHDEEPFVLNSGLLGQVFGYFETLFGKVGEFFTKSGSNSAPNDDPRAALNPLTYRGYLWDEDVGMYYLKSRFYQPQVGRFLNADQVFDTKTGILGTNMFAYCENNPVNKVDMIGLWGTDVHIGRGSSISTQIGSISEYNGTKYGTITWAEQIGFSTHQAKEIAFGNWLLQDFFYRFADYFSLEFWKAQSWHGNGYLFQPMGMILPETRDFRAYETLIELVNKIKEAEDQYENGNLLEIIDAQLFLELVAFYELGRAVHPMQDKHGHHDYFAANDIETILNNWINFPGLLPFDGDNVSVHYDIHSVIYCHWDDAIRSRDETYHILGRFRMAYEGVFR